MDEVFRKIEVGREEVGDCVGICHCVNKMRHQAKIFKVKYQEKAKDGGVLREWEEIHCGLWRDECTNFVNYTLARLAKDYVDSFKEEH